MNKEYVLTLLAYKEMEKERTFMEIVIDICQKWSIMISKKVICPKCNTVEISALNLLMKL